MPSPLAAFPRPSLFLPSYPMPLIFVPLLFFMLVETAQGQVGVARPEVPAESNPVQPARTPLGPASRATKRYTGRLISLHFVNTNVHDVLRMLADVGGVNIIVTDDVRARVTLRLTQVPWDQALDIVLQAAGLMRRETGKTVRVSAD